MNCNWPWCTNKVYVRGWVSYSYCKDHICNGSVFCNNPCQSVENKYCTECISEEHLEEVKRKEKEKKRTLIGLSGEEEEWFKDTDYYLQMENSYDMLQLFKMKKRIRVGYEPEIEQLSHIFWKIIGTFKDETICLQFQWYKVNNHKVCFYHCTSQTVYWPLINEWVRKYLPNYKENKLTSIWSLSLPSLP